MLVIDAASPGLSESAAAPAPAAPAIPNPIFRTGAPVPQLPEGLTKLMALAARELNPLVTLPQRSPRWR